LGLEGFKALEPRGYLTRNLVIPLVKGPKIFLPRQLKAKELFFLKAIF